MIAAAISVDRLSKRYRLGVPGPRTFRDAIVTAVSLPFRFVSVRRAQHAEPLWALRDVSFDVAPGETVGIIGRNGAGKSTLLKILSRITPPSTGSAEIRGRVASLLEVGTGFHPELTGRENIFLNGAILGMSRAEIRARFEAIAAFAEIDRFLDTPAKHYSTGMYVRLAFAVAAHLDAEILIVDEVLAVGDASFQKKCFTRMREVTDAGRTVLFVSHNMGAIVEFCSRALWIAEGRLVADGPAAQIVERYLSQGSLPGEADLHDLSRGHLGPGPTRIQRVQLRDAHGVATTVAHGEPLTIATRVRGTRGASAIVCVRLRSAAGTVVLELNSSDDAQPLRFESDEAEVSVSIAQNCLNEGEYYVSVFVWNQFYQLEDAVEDCIRFSVHTHGGGLNRSKGVIKTAGSWGVR